MRTSTFKTELKFYKQKLHRSTQRITSLNPHIKQQKHQQHEAGGQHARQSQTQTPAPAVAFQNIGCLLNKVSQTVTPLLVFLNNSCNNNKKKATPCLLSLGQLHPSTCTYWKVYWLDFASSRLDLFSELP